MRFAWIVIEFQDFMIFIHLYTSSWILLIVIDGNGFSLIIMISIHYNRFSMSSITFKDCHDSSLTFNVFMDCHRFSLIFMDCHRFHCFYDLHVLLYMFMEFYNLLTI